MAETTYVAAIIPIVVAIRLNMIVRKYRNSGATTPITAKTPTELNELRSLIFNRLLNEDILIAVGNDRYYLNEDNFKEFKRKRGIRILVVVLALLLLIFILDNK